MESQLMIPDHPSVRKLIFAVWSVSGIPDYLNEIIMPKGVVDIVFNFSGTTNILAHIDKYNVNLPRCYMNGFNTLPVSLHIPGYQSFFGIRFNPIAIQPLFDILPGELVNQALDLTLVNNSIETLWYQMAERNNFNERISIFMHWLYNRDIKTSVRDEGLKYFLFNNIDTDISVLSLSKNLLISSRHLSRKLTALTGMNTEEVLLYKKFLRSQILLHESVASLTEIAYACNFYDQSHFIKTFRSYTNLTPGQYRKIKTSLPGHIFQ